MKVRTYPYGLHGGGTCYSGFENVIMSLWLNAGHKIKNIILLLHCGAWKLSMLLPHACLMPILIWICDSPAVGVQGSLKCIADLMHCGISLPGMQKLLLMPDGISRKSCANFHMI